jgi:hypothetical protein
MGVFGIPLEENSEEVPLILRKSIEYFEKHGMVNHNPPFLAS